MADNLNTDEEDLLQSALSDAFAPAPITKVSAHPQPPPATATEPEVAHTPLSETTAEVAAASSSEDEWKTEYDEHLVGWRARSAEQRQKAEAERAKWEAVRLEKEKAGVDWKDSVLEERRRSLKLSESTASVGGFSGSGTASVSGWESVRAENEGGASPSPADARDLVAGETPRAGQDEPSSSSSNPEGVDSHPSSEPDSSKHDKWEEIPSDMTSSFPSMTIPSDLHSPTSSQNLHHSSTRQRYEEQLRHGHHDHHKHHTDKHASATLAAFDTQLSTKTRVLAVASSLAINLLLPFVNGVMLGFGEIFAKNVLVGWLGWKVPGKPVATNVGVRARTQAVGSNPQPRYNVKP
ncbi:hypothetical protein BC835DRAFT_1417663 [Cytidiella melzeri]|nr:hypothetical protein BC835DRAFT_1417663 [Cytidiella melzeri]